MLQQVEQKIQQLKELQAAEYYKKKDEDLQAWGLASKKNGKKVTPIIVTDEEYEALIKASNGVGTTGRNSTANLMKTLSITIIVLGAIIGIALWFSSESLGFVWFTASMIASVIVSVLFRGVGEAISLLQQLIDMKPVRKPDPLHARRQSVPGQTYNYSQAPAANANMAQPPIHQASSHHAPVQPYYGTPVQASVQSVQSAAEPAAPAYGAPQNYNETAFSQVGADFSEIR